MRFGVADPAGPRRRPSSPARSPYGRASLRLREGAQGLLETLLLGAVARPVAAPQRLLAARPDLPGVLGELLSRASGAVGRGARRRRRGGGRGGRAPPGDAREGLLRRFTHR